MLPGARSLALLLLVAAAPVPSRDVAAAPRRVPGSCEGLRFQRISLQQGLSQSTVQCLLEDSRGFLWIGSEYGVNRWDGYTFTIFTHDPDNPWSLAANKVTALAEDAAGFIWVGTETAGLDRLDPTSGRFSHFAHEPAQPASLPSNTVRALLADADGSLWIGTDRGLAHWLPKGHGVTTLHHNPSRADTLSSDTVTALHRGPSGRLWVGTAAGLDLCDPRSGSITRIGLGEGPLRVDALAEARDGTLWVGTRESGLLRYDPARGTLVPFRSTADNAATLSGDDIASLCLDDRGMLWVGTHGHGLNRLDPARGVAQRIAAHPQDADGLPDSDISALLLGRSSILWIGTTLSGLAKLDLKESPFVHYHTTGTGAFRLDSNAVFAVLEDSRGELWVGLASGVQRIDPRAERSTLFTLRGPRLQDALRKPVYAIQEDRDGDLWLGTWTGGLVRLDPNRRQAQVFRHSPRDSGSIAADSVFAIHEDRTGTLWVGTVGGGLDSFDRTSGRFQHHRAGPAPPALSSDTVRAILEDSRGLLWVGTVGGGVSRRDPARGEFSWFRHDPADPGSLSDDTVAALFEDRSGAVWVATAGGLNRYNRETGTFRRFRMRDGLPSDAITGILDDELGRIWVAHFKGLSCLDPGTGEFTNFDASHGLQSDEFNSAAFARGHDGWLYFGGVNGLTAFRPLEVRRHTIAPLVAITSVRAWDEEFLPLLSRSRGSLRFRHDQNYLSFEFVGLEFTAPERIRYACRLEGLDRNWVDLGTRRHVAYAHVAPGSYAFRVRACNNDGVWSAGDEAVRIVVAPPWWETPVARAAAAVAAILLVAVVVRWRTRTLLRKLEEQQRVETVIRESRDQLAKANVELERYSTRLEAMVKERTAQLAAANEELRVLATSDPLTGLANRRRFAEFIDAEWRRARRFARPLAVIMADIDYFKPYNDRHRHQAGDACLRKVAAALAALANRPGDLVARWGGEEFVVVLSETTVEMAAALAERMRTAVEAAAIAHDRAPLGRVTISLGVAATIPGEAATWEQVVAAADGALYEAKAAGRNRVAIAS
ncbi:MAG: diguanylate cyclase [Thermoanaerobaculaceae bacterium]|nr:diguanylate cyclase [Thermoanaerobaculaceae bacterium]